MSKTRKTTLSLFLPQHATLCHAQKEIFSDRCPAMQRSVRRSNPLWHSTVPFTQCTPFSSILSSFFLSPLSSHKQHATECQYHHTIPTLQQLAISSQSPIPTYRFTSIPPTTFTVHYHHPHTMAGPSGSPRIDCQTWQNIPTTSTSPRLAKHECIASCSASCGTSCSQLSSDLLAAFTGETWLVSQSSVHREPTESGPVRTSASRIAAAQVWQLLDGASCEVPARPPILGLAHFYALLFAFQPSNPRCGKGAKASRSPLTPRPAQSDLPPGQGRVHRRLLFPAVRTSSPADNPLMQRP